MEEDIKVLEEMFFDDESFEPVGYIDTNFTKEQQQAIKNLIARNKELEKQMGKDLDVVYLQGVYNERDRWKSKVREKIGEIDKILDRNLLVDRLRDYFTAKKEVLEELLQEGDK